MQHGMTHEAFHSLPTTTRTIPPFVGQSRMLGRMSSIFAKTNRRSTQHGEEDDEASHVMEAANHNLEQSEEEDSMDEASTRVVMTQFPVQQDDESDDDDDDEGLDRLLSSSKRVTKKASSPPKKKNDAKPLTKKTKKAKTPPKPKAKVNATTTDKGSDVGKATAAKDKINDQATVTPTPKKKKRLSPLEQVQATSVQGLQALVEVRTQAHKQQQVRLRQLQKDVKAAQTTLEQLQAAVTQQESLVAEALQDKRAALAQAKALERQWTKAVQAQETQLAKAESKAVAKIKVEAKRKGSVTPTSKSAKKQKRYDDDNDDDSSSDEDWEGAAVTTTAARPKAQRAVRHAAQEWSCSACTFVNPRSNKKCALCETLQPGALPDDDDFSDEEE